jgi:2-phosphoglycerate kinase
MIYLIGGAPRAGKSVLCQQFAATHRIGWISTDLLVDQLRVNGVEGAKSAWDATPEAISRDAEWFFPCLERFVWGASAIADDYVIEGVDFLPAHVKQLDKQYDIRAVFMGLSRMTLEQFDEFPGRSHGYKHLPKEVRRQFAHDVPRWSAFIHQECERHGCPYIDMAGDFAQRLLQAEAVLMAQSPGVPSGDA